MCDNESNVHAETEGEQPSYQPASFQRRVIAWVGVAYMIILVLATTYMIATAQYLSGTAGILVCPAAAGIAVLAIHRYRVGEMARGRNFTIALVFLCIAASAVGLSVGVPNLMTHLRGLFA